MKLQRITEFDVCAQFLNQMTKYQFSKQIYVRPTVTKCACFYVWYITVRVCELRSGIACSEDVWRRNLGDN